MANKRLNTNLMWAWRAWPVPVLEGIITRLIYQVHLKLWPQLVLFALQLNPIWLQSQYRTVNAWRELATDLEQSCDENDFRFPHHAWAYLMWCPCLHLFAKYCNSFIVFITWFFNGLSDVQTYYAKLSLNKTCTCNETGKVLGPLQCFQVT